MEMTFRIYDAETEGIVLWDENGREIGERMDNLIHASASDAEAGREIKLWFIPGDIPPAMRAYPTEINEEHYYFKDGKLYTAHEPGSICLLAPGDVVWKSDMEALRQLYRDLPADCSLERVAAKYFINYDSDSHKRAGNQDN